MTMEHVAAAKQTEQAPSKHLLWWGLGGQNTRGSNNLKKAKVRCWDEEKEIPNGGGGGA